MVREAVPAATRSGLAAGAFLKTSAGAKMPRQSVERCGSWLHTFCRAIELGGSVTEVWGVRRGRDLFCDCARLPAAVAGGQGLQ
jgi:hypothetical protein